MHETKPKWPMNQLTGSIPPPGAAPQSPLAPTFVAPAPTEPDGQIRVSPQSLDEGATAPADNTDRRAERPTLDEAAAPRVPPPGLALRDINLDQVATAIRRWLDLHGRDGASGVAAAMYRRQQGPAILFRDVDAEGWLAWTLCGIYLFAAGPPAMDDVRREAKRAAVCLAMTRCRGSIAAAARMLGISRKVLRENLRAAGLYPWGSRPPRVG
ncbi:MAG: hypothetical protein K0V04_27275 [Deltaproteobacteria bacterium]|nr:hypothetical protein [Deltaproteobacteria bacterium]